MNELNMARVVPVVDIRNPVERIAILFDDHFERLYRLARRLTASADDALDLVQETFLKATRYPRSIPVGFAQEEAWLVRVLINIRRDQWRKTEIRTRFEATMSEGSFFVPTNADPERAAIVRTRLWRALDILSPRRRAVLVMHELEGLSIPAIASLLGISRITVRWHLSTGKRELTTALTAHTEE
jgi:RNA polymerase sigma-70 factor, ECF subfamily